MSEWIQLPETGHWQYGADIADYDDGDTEPGIVGGRLSLDTATPEGESVRLLTVAPFTQVKVGIEPTYDRPDSTPGAPFWFSVPPKLLYVDLTIRVRLPAGSTPDGVLYQMIQSPPAETTEDVIRRVLTAADEEEHVAIEWLTSVLMDALRKAGRA